MTIEQIRALGSALSEYLGEFADCFGSPDTRSHLREYVQGQLSDLPRKSVEPMAHLAGVPPRTLQEFLSQSDWDHGRMRDVVQQVVARDHADPQSIGVVDESGHPKRGDRTACVQRQYCGNTGKVDNCVMTVHLCYASGDAAFRTMLDADLYLPASWDRDQARRAAAAVPRDVRYRTKYDIALGQLARARANGVNFAWVTADEWYGAKPAFVAGLEAMGQRFVLEIPKNLRGWLREPAGADAGNRGAVADLVRWSTPMLYQGWTAFHVKDTGAGAMVWEARAAPFWTRRGRDVVGPYWLVAARDALDRDAVKYFLSNAPAGTPLEAILHVAFARWPVERCLEDQKSELGLSHFECRKHDAVLRHLLVTLVSHLFLARQCSRLRGEKPGRDDLPGAGRGRRPAGRAAAEPGRPTATAGQGGPGHPMDAGAERRVQGVSRQGAVPGIARRPHPGRKPTLLYPAVTAVAL